jgi:hypothetical protein
LALSGCATTGQNKDYAAYLAAAQAAASKPAEPLLRIRALPGQTVELRGIELFEVFAPAGNAQATIATPPVQQPHPGWQIASQALGIVGGILPGYWTGKWMNALAGTVGDSAAAIAGGGFGALQNVATTGFGSTAEIARLIQAPMPTVTLSGSGVIGAGAFTGANSGANAGNSGLIGNENHSPKPITTTTTTTTTTNNCAGGSTTNGAGGSC